MSCNACSAFRQYCYNFLLTCDLTLNSVLLWGDPHESVSQRTARARAAGSRAAAAFCKVLTFFSNIIGNHGDHCTWALAKQDADADEIWHWSPPGT